SPASCTISPSMPSPGKAGVTEQRQAADFLHEARERERAACLPEAMACYEAAVAAAERGGEQTVLAEALRRLAVVRGHRSEGGGGRAPGMAPRGGLLLPGEPRPPRAGRRRVSAGTLPRQSRRGGRDTAALRGRSPEGGGGSGGVRPAGCAERQSRGLSGNRHGVP